MASRPQTRAELIDLIEAFLQDSSNATWSAADLGLLLDDAITEVSQAVPYVMRDVYQLETRTGSASSTSTNNLVDSGESQFASGDVGKTVYNVDDQTWAVITSFSSSSQVGLSRDIFTSGEQYEIYNEGCWSKKQINIKDSDDWLWIIGVSYPVNRADYSHEIFRNHKLYDQNKILELDIAYVDDTKDTDAYKDVHVYFARQHKVNNMTDLAGEVDLGAGYSAGDTSMVVDGLQSSGTVYKDTLFYFTQIQGITANSRLTYRVTADFTISTNEGTASFWPGLESAVSDNDDITFIRSTLTPELERIIVDIVVGQALMSKSVKHIDAIPIGGPNTSSRYYSQGERIAEKARIRLHRKVDVNLRSDKVYSRN